MNLPRFLRRVNRVVTNPVLGLIAGLLPPFAVVQHMGRKSGRAYRTPVLAFRRGQTFVIPLTYGRDVDWAQNLLASGDATVVQMGHRHALRNPRIVDGPEARPFLPPLIGPILVAANLPGFVLLDG